MALEWYWAIVAIAAAFFIGIPLVARTLVPHAMSPSLISKLKQDLVERKSEFERNGDSLRASVADEVLSKITAYQERKRGETRRRGCRASRGCPQKRTNKSPPEAGLFAAHCRSTRRFVSYRATMIRPANLSSHPQGNKDCDSKKDQRFSETVESHTMTRTLRGIHRQKVFRGMPRQFQGCSFISGDKSALASICFLTEGHILVSNAEVLGRPASRQNQTRRLGTIRHKKLDNVNTRPTNGNNDGARSSSGRGPAPDFEDRSTIFNSPLTKGRFGTANCVGVPAVGSVK